MSEQKRQWGLTPPVQLMHPSKAELDQTDSLLEELKRQNNFEAPEDTNRRHVVLAKLQAVTEEFVREVGRGKKLPQSVIQNGGGRVYTFGSYRLGVFGPGSDIDTLIVGPKHVTRDDFFREFPTILARMSDAGAIEEITPVPEAHVPIIKLEYMNISVDLIYASIPTVSSVNMSLDLITNNQILQGLDDTDMRSVNGTRVADQMLQLVPETKTFRQALRAIKLWANRRAIYANVMGFPGGVAWALMVARVCQLYPYATGSTLVYKFFNIMAGWPWPNPIMLKEIEDGPHRVWNPNIYGGDKRHLMPIVTPAFPSMCATHNITKSTQKIIQREISRGKQIALDISVGRKPWKDLFVRQTFFTQDYRNYISIIATSRTKEASSIWSGYVQSKVRTLVTNIERLSEAGEIGIALTHPFNKGFERVHRCKLDDIAKVEHGSLDFQVKDIETETTDPSKDIKQAIAAEGASDRLEMPSADGLANGDEVDGMRSVWTVTYYVGVELLPGEKTLDISGPVEEWKHFIREWQQYNPEINTLNVTITKCYDLPDDVFEPGESKPQKTKKAKASQRKTQPVSHKRTLAEAAIDDGDKDSNAKRRPYSNGIAMPHG